MRELVEFLVRSLVDDPDAVEVEEFDEDGDLVLEVTVADDDLGRVSGGSHQPRRCRMTTPVPIRPTPAACRVANEAAVCGGPLIPSAST